MPRLPLLALVLVCASVATFAQNVAYRLHPQEQIMERLKLAADKNEDRQATLKKLFAEEDCTGQRLSDQPVKHAKLGNVVCTLPGETDQVVLVTAHFDKVSHGMGVTDNWSGASLLPSLLYGLSGTPRKHTFVFIGFTDEEKGMVGSQFYASHLSNDQRAKIHAVINMDTLGLGPTEVWSSHADPDLVRDMVAVGVALHTNLIGMNVEQIGSTDSESFAKYKIPRLTIHSLTQQTLPILHTDKDQLSVIKPDDYYTTYKFIAVFLAYLDGKLPASTNAVADAQPTLEKKAAKQ
jgi:putative aminopeptidase FrvX